jgi:hypothetical protein
MSKLENERIYSAIMKDPFMSLRPGLTFESMDWRSDFITIEEILAELELRLEDYGKKDDERTP